MGIEHSGPADGIMGRGSEIQGAAQLSRHGDLSLSQRGQAALDPGLETNSICRFRAQV